MAEPRGMRSETLDEAFNQFHKGVESYFRHVAQVPMMRPEPEGLEGIVELIEMERRGREYELSILHWPPSIPPNFVLVVKDLVSISRTTISYNQAALDELQALLKAKPSMAIFEFRLWAERVWRNGELERSSSGMAISNARNSGT